ncbi:hypothetical protein F5Y16DRAFT_356567 [Xylariaceae sp. FL0255]|nr:hypothetical protein F5Y16DRAFT_356567 [Xylariaceae sp. FL0255]
MKYGERLEEASVPGWSLHNVDYNSLKHQIRVHTTKDQATTAITIPGQQDYGLRKFEDAFYVELCNQHNRVNLFVNSKTDEIARRLRYLSELVQQLLLKCTDARGISPKRHRRFVKYHMQIEDCHQDIKALDRFVSAQVTAFRKILKKYKKWTGSTTLSSRFKENVLANPKSLTHRDFTHLQLQYEELRTTLTAAAGTLDGNTAAAASPDLNRQHTLTSSHRNSRRPSQSSARPFAPPAPPPPPAPVTTYWNEYDNGSEAGDHNNDDEYVIYIDPNATHDVEFPGISYIMNMFHAPVDRVRHWLHAHDSIPSASSCDPQDTLTGTTTTTTTTTSETQSLLDRQQQQRRKRGRNGNCNGDSSTASSPIDYFTIRRPATGITTDNDATEDEEDGLSSEEERASAQPYYTYEPSFADYKVQRYQDQVLTQAVIIAFIAAFVLVGISGLLIATGRPHFRLEVDAGAATGSVLSLFCACMGLGAMIYRQYPGDYLYSLTVWVAFIVVCVLNGMVLVLVVGSNGI